MKWKSAHTLGAIALVALASAAIKHDVFHLFFRRSITFRRAAVEQAHANAVTAAKPTDPPLRTSKSYRCGNHRFQVAAPIPTPPPPLPSPTPSTTLAQSDYQAIVDRAVNQFQSLGLSPHEQSLVVMDRDGQAIATHNGSMMLADPASAELAKTLAHLETWSSNHRFVTRIYTSGERVRGTLQGDVWVQSSMPAELLWETSSDIAARLQERHIHSINGNVSIIGSSDIDFGHLPMQPLEGIDIRGDIRIETTMPDRASLLLSYPSQPLVNLIDARNTFGQNAAAEILAEASTSKSRVFTTVDRTQQFASNSMHSTTPAAVATTRIRIGDSTHQRFSALSTATLLHELKQAAPIDNLLPTVGLDADTLTHRDLPIGTAIKTGTRAGLASLGGVLPDGTVFVAFNQGNDVEALRAAQDQFVRDLTSLSRP